MNMTQQRKDDLLERLDSFRIKGENEDDCYGWIGATCSNGTPRISVRGKSQGANRAAWIAEYGKIPKFHFVRSTCCNRSCTNIKHLFISLLKGPKTKPTELKSYRESRRRLGVDLHVNQINLIKKMAHKRNMTVTRFISIIITGVIARERQFDDSI